MAEQVEVVVDGRKFHIARPTQERWPDDYPLTTTKSGKPTAAAKRAEKVVIEKAPTADTTLTADDLKAAGSTDAGDGATTPKEA